MPSEADKLMQENMSKNLIGMCFLLLLENVELTRLCLDSDEYPATRTFDLIRIMMANIHFFRFRNHSYSLYV